MMGRKKVKFCTPSGSHCIENKDSKYKIKFSINVSKAKYT